MHFALRLIHMERDAGRRIKFAPGKSLQFSQLFLGNLLSKLRYTVFIPGAAEQIHKSPTAIFSHPTCLTNISTALFEKEIWKEKPPRFRCSKMPRIWKENPLKWVVPISQKYQVYFEITWKSSNSEEVRKSSGNRRLFPGQIWSCNRRDSFVWDMTHPRETGRRNMFMIKMIAHDSVKNDFAHDLSKMILHMTYQKWCRTWLIDIISLSQQNDLAHDSVEKRSCTWLIDIISLSHQNDLAHDSSKMILHMTYWHRFTESTK